MKIQNESNFDATPEARLLYGVKACYARNNFLIFVFIIQCLLVRFINQFTDAFYCFEMCLQTKYNVCGKIIAPIIFHILIIFDN